jgi:hypothetical protein
MASDRSINATWQTVLPKGYNSVLFLFAPTRSDVTRAKIIIPASWEGHGGADTRFRGIAKLVERPSGENDHETPVKIETYSDGEPLSLLGALPFEKKHNTEFYQKQIDKWYGQIDFKRRVLAEIEQAFDDSRHMFLYELDRNTNLHFLQFVIDPATPQYQERIALVARLGNQLWNRLLGRIGIVCKSCEPDINDLIAVSEIFKNAAIKSGLGFTVPSLSGVFLDFAAGWMGKVLSVSANQVLCPYMLNEPDSCSVFLFAEFAIAGEKHGIEKNVWNDRLIPALVHMQRYYLERVLRTHPQLCLDKYESPRSWLNFDDRNKLQAEYPTKTNYPDKIIENLRLVDTSCLMCR